MFNIGSRIIFTLYTGESQIERDVMYDDLYIKCLDKKPVKIENRITDGDDVYIKISEIERLESFDPISRKTRYRLDIQGVVCDESKNK